MIYDDTIPEELESWLLAAAVQVRKGTQLDKVQPHGDPCVVTLGDHSGGVAYIARVWRAKPTRPFVVVPEPPPSQGDLGGTEEIRMAPPPGAHKPGNPHLAVLLRDKPEEGNVETLVTRFVAEAYERGKAGGIALGRLQRQIEELEERLAKP